MADLDSKLRGEKNVNYASDSEDDESPSETQPGDVENSGVSGPRTGPKGVLEDYRMYKEMKKIEDEEALTAKIAMHKKFAFTADPNKFPEKNGDIENKDEFDDIEADDEFLRRYHEKRMAQLKNEVEAKLNPKLTKYGKCFELSGDELLNTIENEEEKVLVVVHLFDSSLKMCIQMNKCFDCLAHQYPYIKFCKVSATSAGLSLRFKANALPAIQVYKGGSLIGNFIKMADYLDHEFFASDVENFLIDSNVISCLSSSSNGLEDHDYDLD